MFVWGTLSLSSLEAPPLSPLLIFSHLEVVCGKAPGWDPVLELSPRSPAPSTASALVGCEHV